MNIEKHRKPQDAILKEERRKSAQDAILEAAKDWPGIISRSQIPQITGGALSSGTMANLDSQGKGVPGAFRVGKKTVYLRNNFAEWLIGRLEI